VITPWRVTLAVLAAVVLGASAADVQFVRYFDENGTPHYVQGFDRVPERYRSSAVSLDYRNAPTSTPDPAAGDKPERPRGTTVVRYTPGQPIMVNVRLNGSASAQLMIDTGADRTLISPRALAAAGASLTRPIATGQMQGVTGSDRMDFVVVNSIEIGDARVGRMPVASYEMPNARGDGLLGRDFLDHFNVSIDAARGEVTLAPK
jgi:predicted aspartyl protease